MGVCIYHTRCFFLCLISYSVYPSLTLSLSLSVSLSLSLSPTFLLHLPNQPPTRDKKLDRLVNKDIADEDTHLDKLKANTGKAKLGLLRNRATYLYGNGKFHEALSRIEDMLELERNGECLINNQLMYSVNDTRTRCLLHLGRSDEAIPLVFDIVSVMWCGVVLSLSPFHSPSLSVCPSLPPLIPSPSPLSLSLFRSPNAAPISMHGRCWRSVSLTLVVKRKPCLQRASVWWCIKIVFDRGHSSPHSFSLVLVLQMGISLILKTETIHWLCIYVIDVHTISLRVCLACYFLPLVPSHIFFTSLSLPLSLSHSPLSLTLSLSQFTHKHAVIFPLSFHTASNNGFTKRDFLLPLSTSMFPCLFSQSLSPSTSTFSHHTPLTPIPSTTDLSPPQRNSYLNYVKP